MSPSAGQFPTASILNKKLQDEWRYNDQSFYPLTEHAYAQVLDHWREVHRESAVKGLRLRLAEMGFTSPTIQQINELLQSVQEVWRFDPAGIATQVFEAGMEP